MTAEALASECSRRDRVELDPIPPLSMRPLDSVHLSWCEPIRYCSYSICAIMRPMRFGRFLREARRRAGLSQKELAERAGAPQSTVARIESGATDPRVGTLQKLLRICGEELEPMPLLGIGIDRSQIQELLRLSPSERLDQAVASANNLERFRKAVRVSARG